MAPRSQSRPRKRPTNQRFEEDPPLGILVSAKRIGLSFQELNILTLEDYTSFVEMWVGEEDGAPRRATQDDINSILG